MAAEETGEHDQRCPGIRSGRRAHGSPSAIL
jgi:hypothetical protein